MHNLSIMLHKENLLNNQEHFKLIISFILTTPVSDLVGILVGEIRCLSLLRVKYYYWLSFYGERCSWYMDLPSIPQRSYRSDYFI